LYRTHRTAPHAPHTAPHRTAPHRTAPHRTAPHRTAPHRTAPHRTAPHRANVRVSTRTANARRPRCAILHRHTAGARQSVVIRHDAVRVGHFAPAAGAFG
jgi:hypothetical protein